MPIYNFNPGPAILPREILEQAQKELLDYQGLGYSILEMSHRSPVFEKLLQDIETDIRDLLKIPSNYHVLFCHGGARQQFAMVPMNFLKDHPKADYIVTGAWSSMAYDEARKYGDIHVAAQSEHDFSSIPAPKTWNVRSDASYLHYTSNETIHGVQFHFTPNAGKIPLISDMSSDLFTRPIDVKRHGLIYAAAQKNFGPSGLTLVIVREDLVKEPLAITPGLMDYRNQVREHSLYNTPPTFSWYLGGLYIKWIQEQGGLNAMEKLNKEKAKILYDYIDRSNFYHNAVHPTARSWVSVPFTLAKREFENKFLTDAEQRGFIGLKGHPRLGGFRASLYNALSIDAVKALIAFMDEFMKKQVKPNKNQVTIKQASLF